MVQLKVERVDDFLTLPFCVLFLAEFIEGVSQFSVKGDKEQKLRCESLSSWISPTLSSS